MIYGKFKRVIFEKDDFKMMVFTAYKGTDFVVKLDGDLVSSEFKEDELYVLDGQWMDSGKERGLQLKLTRFITYKEYQAKKNAKTQQTVKAAPTPKVQSDINKQATIFGNLLSTENK
ncbi:hypothetical protein [Vibrio breoganii]|uniref:hypothetical protein n=1 Tax=Vibrio breoganii TaxID=553239 RepID=UPI000C849E8C|nr:hypothetical protein [Vibrio breoganii]PMK33051.1 hypothetical protein BCU03_04660 [Vibrio breoganii]